MPTATSFTWTFPWAEMVGGFNSFMGMLNTPVGLSIALILAFLVSSFVISVVRRGIFPEREYQSEEEEMAYYREKYPDSDDFEFEVDEDDF